VRFSPFIKDVDYAKTEHLLVQVIYAHNKSFAIVDDTSVVDNGLGCAVMSLAKVDLSSQTFKVVIEKAGQAVGSFSCKLNFEWAGEVERDARKLSWMKLSRSPAASRGSRTSSGTPADGTPHSLDRASGTMTIHTGS
jgi:hypothetical protein